MPGLLPAPWANVSFIAASRLANEPLLSDAATAKRTSDHSVPLRFIVSSRLSAPDEEETYRPPMISLLILSRHTLSDSMSFLINDTSLHRA